jgi:hypothetical protein
MGEPGRPMQRAMADGPSMLGKAGAGDGCMKGAIAVLFRPPPPALQRLPAPF